jgi:hypothetical protein
MTVILTAIDALNGLKQATPRVRDIVSFTASAVTSTDDTRLAVRRSGQSGCILAMDVLRHSGGSLVVESQITEAADSFRVHWAGARTTADSDDCGDRADLILEGRELDILAAVAGGYGAGQAHLPVMIADTDPARAGFTLK